MKRNTEYRRIAKRIFLDANKAAKLFKISRKTALRWQKQGSPYHVVKYLQLAFDRKLDAIHPEWKGFCIGLNGKLYGPNKLQISANHLRHWHEVESK